MKALITGAAGGLGHALATAVIGNGGTVVGVDRDRAGLAKLGRAATAIHADLSEIGGLESLGGRIAAAGPFDLAVLNAGISATGLFETVPVGSQASVITVNLTAPMALSGALLRGRALAPGATLVFVASLSRFTGYPGAATYGATKQGIAAFAKSLRKPLARQGIHVLTVFPGPLDTPHAARHAPPGKANATAHRMAPDVAARAILRKMGRSGILVPGVYNKAAAVLGTIAPDIATAAIRRSIFDHFQRAAHDQ